MTSATYKHRYRIDEDYFLRMCMERGWDVIPILGLYYICDLPARIRRLGKYARFRVVDYCIGVYGPKVSRCFHTDRVPKKPDPRVVPWCDCCWQREAPA